MQQAKKYIAAYGVLSAAVLIVVVVLAATGHHVSSFLWGRTGGVLGSAVVAYWLAGKAQQGARWAHVRLRIITLVVPVAIVAIDTLVPGLPAWFVIVQLVGAVTLLPAALAVHRSAVPAKRPA